MNSPRTTLYRDKHNAKLMGVCSGIADYTGVNALWVRLGFLVLLFTVAPILLPAYFIAGMLLSKKPPHLYVDKEEQQYWQRVRQSPKRTAREIRARFRDVDRRLAEVEHHYVSSNPRLTAEIERLR
ncbi:MAG: envelope stress response membrane protein PspC [Altererythrobacter sp.]|uniref:Envelope stress response membrane protein PspC n=1 Tax=Altererythrobacter rubellus TaxID=2173831 RepID=A0A9Y2F9R4_9SPHN|nr:envelope stress response membrane protein PspC [Altererythrobacter rubellus]NBS23657.1 envelope stress response membrane protein PspC [Altererythrobacter sp.]PWL25583.1 MAG: envelope stress response membrane protein PspC [Altererythrobacter sp. XM-24bin4]WIW96281.1 envelope stress response membrane protein PspC [Altererythrobacter rubellus]